MRRIKVLNSTNIHTPVNTNAVAELNPTTTLKSVFIKNFGIFTNETLEFSSGINVFIGRNGCGKSSLLRLLYTLVKECGDPLENGNVLEAKKLDNRLSSLLAKIFRPDGGHLGQLVQRDKGNNFAEVSATFTDGNKCNFTLGSLGEIIGANSNVGKLQEAVYLYSKKVRSLCEKFDETFHDTCLTGFLFLDETEKNLDPKTVVQMSENLLRLANQGVQVFVVTHDYLLTTRLSLASEYHDVIPEDQRCSVKFFGLDLLDSDDKRVSVSSGSKLSDLQNNHILDEYAALYDYEGMLFQKSSARK